MFCPRGKKRIKTDRRYAGNIAECLAYGGYSPIYVSSEQNSATRKHIRMRDDHANMLKSTKQQIHFFCFMNIFCYTAKKWTTAHLKYIREINKSLHSESGGELDEYLTTLEQLRGKIKNFVDKCNERLRRRYYKK